MKSFKFFWTAHKWTGIILAAVFTVTAVTGFLLLIKKRVDWIQPPTMIGEAGEPQDFKTIDEVLQAVWDADHPDFQSPGDIDRFDFRPSMRVHKVRSIHNHSEIQVDAVSGKVLSIGTRRSDFIEQIHDGQFIGQWFHNWAMPVVSAGLLFLVCSGLWLWLEPRLRKRRRKKRQAAGLANGR